MGHHAHEWLFADDAQMEDYYVDQNQPLPTPDVEYHPSVGEVLRMTAKKRNLLWLELCSRENTLEAYLATTDGSFETDGDLLLELHTVSELLDVIRVAR